MEYGFTPAVVETNYSVPALPEVHTLYLPVKMVGSAEVRLPQEAEPYRRIVDRCIFDFGNADYHYIYMTAKTTETVPGEYHKRPGWHSDGFSTDDINYIWYSCFPTVFNNGPFVDIDDSCQRSMDQFEKQADPAKGYSVQARTLLQLDDSMIHKTPDITSRKVRTFIKISFSKNRYNLIGNTHNPLFDYSWRMYDRKDIRNHPTYAEADFVPENLELST